MADDDSPQITDPAAQPPAAEPTRTPFFRRTWAWIVGAVVAVLILLGGGIGIGWAVSRESGHADRNSSEHGSDSGDRHAGDGRGGDSRKGDSRGTEESTQNGEDTDDDGSTPSPTPSASATP